MNKVEYRFKPEDTVWCMMADKPREGKVSEVKILINANKIDIGYFINSHGRMEFKSDKEVGSTKEELFKLLENL